MGPGHDSTAQYEIKMIEFDVLLPKNVKPIEARQSVLSLVSD